MSALRKCGFVIGFGLFWCGLTGLFDVFVFRNIIGQLRATGFAATSGMIERSSLAESPDDAGRVSVRYRYEVDGKAYTSRRYRYYDDSSFSLDRARGEVALPMTCGRQRRVVVPISQVRGVEVHAEIEKGNEGDTTWYYPCLMVVGNPELREARLAKYGEREKAERLVGWLRLQLPFPEPIPKPAESAARVGG